MFLQTRNLSTTDIQENEELFQVQPGKDMDRKSKDGKVLLSKLRKVDCYNFDKIAILANKDPAVEAFLEKEGPIST